MYNKDFYGTYILLYVNINIIGFKEKYNLKLFYYHFNFHESPTKSQLPLLFQTTEGGITQ